ncbi:flagellar protein FlaG [Bacillus norwichensis]|nr:flagellar protein FlaG [Bacillus norwichensis]
MIGSIGGRLPVDGTVMPVRSVIGSGESNRESTTSKERSYELSEKDATALLERAVAFANSHLKTSKQYLKFEYHDQLNKYYVKVVNEDTEEVVREIPPKKLLDMFAAMANAIGILVDKKI